MKWFLEKLKPQIYSIFRFVMGFLFLWHGSMKLFSYPPTTSGGSMPFLFFLVVGIIEFGGGLLVMLGLFTPIAAFIVCGQMAVAYWMVHGLHGVLPIVNGGELAVLYCFAFLYISAKGSGKWSLDSLIFKKKK